MATTKYPSKAAFKAVSEQLAAGQDLTIEMIGDVFGKEFYLMMMYAFMDSNDAARAIQIASLKVRKLVQEEEEPSVN
jgi:hypothetical protein